MNEATLSVRELFELIVDLPIAERAARAATLTNDAALQKHALSLAAASDVRTSRATKISHPMMDIVEGLAGTELQVGDTLGAWNLQRPLGHGGMGAVFLADRCDGQFEQRAAIKILQGLASEAALLLLAKERQILANLSHPNIARLLDGGATPKGRPYLVMEFIDGLALDAYVKSKALNLRERLKLFIQICHAVAFAHTRLVVHCDLKPSNVMVENNGRPVLLDFGIATLVDPNITAAVGADVHAFTPQYASPELQAGAPVDTATDVYSLGVMLREQLENAAHADLSAIVTLATKAPPLERYKTVAAMTQDIEKYLANFPISARPNTLAYVSQKLLRRRWPVFVMGAVVATMLGVFVMRITQERNIAKREAITAERVTEFVVSLFEGADPDKQGRQDVTALSLVEKGRTRIATELKDQPIVQSRLYEKLALVYEKIGRSAQAAELYDVAIEVERKILPVQPERLSSLLIHAALFKSNNRIAGPADLQARESLALREQAEGLTSTNVAQSLDMLGLIISADGKHAEAEPLMRRALVIRELRGGKDPDEDLASSYHNLGLVFRRKHDYARAVEFYTTSIAIKEKRFGTSHPRYFNTTELLGEALGQLGKTAEAEKILREALAARRKIHGDKNARVALTMRHLGVALMAGGKFSAAIPILEESLGISANANGVRTAIYVSTLMPLAEAYESAGRVDEAEKLFTQALAISIEILPPSHLSLAEARYNFGKFLMRRASMARAKPMLFEAESARIAKLAADDPVRLQSIVAVAAWQISEPELSHANDSRDAVARLNQVAPFANNFHPLDKADWLQVSQRLALAKGDTQSAAQLLVTRQETLRKYLHTGDARLQTASLIFPLK